MFGGVLFILWAAMAAWMLHYFPRHLTDASNPSSSDRTSSSRESGTTAVPSRETDVLPSPTEDLEDCSAFFNIPGLRFQNRIARKGDTFGRLSLQFNLREETLRSLNQANSRTVDLQAEDVVLIPSKDGIFHMIREGQGLSDIAHAYGVPLKEVLAYTRKRSDQELQPGEILYLPGARFLWDTDPAWIALSALSRSTGFMRPISARFTDAYGQRMHPILRKEIFHGGLDLAAGMGTPVMAAQDGKVIFEGPRGNYGTTVILDHGNGLTSWYGHLSQSLVKQGKSVKRGDVIGKVGKTGLATGPHLHFEIRKNNVSQNPLLYIGK